MESLRIGGTAFIKFGGWPHVLHDALIVLQKDGQRLLANISNSDGAWSQVVSPGMWSISAAVRGYALQAQPSTIEVASGHVKVGSVEILPRPGVSGRLLACDATPMSGVSVRLRSSDSEPVLTNSRGVFVLGPVPLASRHEVLIDEATLPEGIRPPWWQWKEADIVGDDHLFQAAVAGPVRDILLSSPISVSGFATDPNDDPICNGNLSIRMLSDSAYPIGPNFVIQTGVAGAFEGVLAPGLYEAWCFPSSWPEGQARPDPVTGIEIGCGAPTQFLSLPFDQGIGSASINVLVIDSQGDPVPEILLRVDRLEPGKTPENYAMFMAKAAGRSGDDGQVLVQSLPLGRYLITRPDVNDRKRMLVDYQQYLEIESSQSPSLLTWTLDAFTPASISGQISSRPVCSAGERLRLDLHPWNIRRETITDPQGHFRFDRLPPGEASILPLDSDAEEGPVSVRLSEGEELSIEL